MAEIKVYNSPFQKNFNTGIKYLLVGLPLFILEIFCFFYSDSHSDSVSGQTLLGLPFSILHSGLFGEPTLGGIGLLLFIIFTPLLLLYNALYCLYGAWHGLPSITLSRKKITIQGPFSSSFANWDSIGPFELFEDKLRAEVIGLDLSVEIVSEQTCIISIDSLEITGDTLLTEINEWRKRFEK